MRGCGRVSLCLRLLVIPFSNAAIEILFPVLLVCWLIGWKPFSIQRSPSEKQVFFALLAYLGVCTWSVAYSQYPHQSLSGLIGKTLEYALFFWIAADVAQHPKTSERGLKFLFAAAWLVIAYGLLQEWTIAHPVAHSMPLDPITHKPLNYVRMIGPYKNPNDLATFLMVAALIAFGMLSRRPRFKFDSTLLLGLAATGCLVWTKSLGALLGFAAGAAAILWTTRRKSVWIWAGILLVILVSGVIAYEPQIIQNIRLLDVGSQERRVMWHTAWRMILERPWTGLGLNTFMSNYQSYAPDYSLWPAYAHNCFLQIAAETGLLGLSTFLWFLFCLFRPLARRTSQAGWIGLTAALIAFLVQSVFDTNLYVLRQAVLFWTLAGVAFAQTVSDGRSS